jgi:hypothetical protein
MIKPKTITITRAEGLIEECDKPETATTWEEANAILRRWSDTAPKTGGYDKCDFVIVFDDGQDYKGRYDLQHWECGRPDLAAHVRAFVNYLAGTPPAWLLKPGKENYLKHYREKVAADTDAVAEAKRWLDTYDVGQMEQRT